MALSPSSAPAANANVIFQGPPSCCGNGHAEWCNNTVWLITDQYVQREKGICCRSIDNVQLIRVKDIAYNGACCCACCGTVTIYSTDETNPLLLIKGLPNGKDVYHKLRDAVSQLQSSGKAQIEIKA